MEQLDGKWILVKDTKCPEKDTSPATLGLTNMAGACEPQESCSAWSEPGVVIQVPCDYCQAVR